MAVGVVDVLFEDVGEAMLVLVLLLDDIGNEQEIDLNIKPEDAVKLVLISFEELFVELMLALLLLLLLLLLLNGINNDE